MSEIDSSYRPSDDSHLDAVSVAKAALLDPSMEHVVEMVLLADGEAYEAHAADGSVRFRRARDGWGWTFSEEAVTGRNPLGDQSLDRFTPLHDEQANAYPNRSENSYPFGYEQVAQIFDAEAAPDIVSVHTSSHNWEDQGGHLGEHGSIAIVQARAPFIVAGAGIDAKGTIPQACRLVDIAPTVMQLLGAQPCGGTSLNGCRRDDALLARQDGEVQWQLIDTASRPPDHVIGLLLDGANANVLYDLVARGEAPNIERLMNMGTTLGHGAMSSLPTVTLANHTSILTGAHPGHHGILNNAWWDRAKGEQVITNSPLHWISAMDWLDPSVETLYQAVKRAFPGSVTVSINEPCDTGADHSVFGVMRRGEKVDRPPPLDELPHTTHRFVRPGKDYAWSSLIDHTAVDQFRGIWGGSYRGTEWPLPRFTWVNFSLTDAAMHEGGPYSEIGAASVHDTDERIGELLDSVERAGVFDRTAFFVTADHGMEENNPECTGNWAEALDDCGVAYRDEGYSFIYVNP